jgi:hypothetical protein
MYLETALLQKSYYRLEQGIITSIAKTQHGGQQSNSCDIWPQFCQLWPADRSNQHQIFNPVFLKCLKASPYALKPNKLMRPVPITGKLSVAIKRYYKTRPPLLVAGFHHQARQIATSGNNAKRNRHIFLG